jgi:hypothetical protein
MTRVSTRIRRLLQASSAGLLITLGLALALLPQNWIEQVLGKDPDGGDGLFELGLVLVPLAIGVSLAAWLAMSVRADRRRLSLLKATTTEVHRG